mmetsp:Transcript_105570/g.329058  ORF Transcript_105570/g.329058 Transcript_105570/m.329058 type:complete len:110 (+) Transcript_105570:209-538(+)
MGIHRVKAEGDGAAASTESCATLNCPASLQWALGCGTRSDRDVAGGQAAHMAPGGQASAKQAITHARSGCMSRWLIGDRRLPLDAVPLLPVRVPDALQWYVSERCPCCQ